MSEFVIMPKEDLVEIGDTTRELSQNDESIVADVLSANLRTAVVSVGGGKAVTYLEQSLTEEQKEQARNNIGAISKEGTILEQLKPIEEISNHGHDTKLLNTGKFGIYLYPKADANNYTFMLPDKNIIYLLINDINGNMKIMTQVKDVHPSSLFHVRYENNILTVMIGVAEFNYIFDENGNYVGKGNVLTPACKSDIVNPVQSDWEQNDETQLDYVKNRPCYSGEKLIPCLIDFSRNVEYESSDQDVAVDYWYHDEENPDTYPSFSFICNEDYTNFIVNFDGSEYRVSSSSSDCNYLGNESLISGSGEDNGLPFCISYVGGSDAGPDQNLVAARTNGNHVWSVYAIKEEIHQLDEKYIPDTIARSEDTRILPIDRLADFGAEVTLNEYNLYTITVTSTMDNPSDYLFHLPASNEDGDTGYRIKAQRSLTGTDTQSIITGLPSPHSLLFHITNDSDNNIVRINEVHLGNQYEVQYDSDGNYIDDDSSRFVVDTKLISTLNSKLNSESYNPTNPTDVATKEYVDDKSQTNIPLTVDFWTSMESNNISRIDSTYDEITSALENGQTIQGKIIGAAEGSSESRFESTDVYPVLYLKHEDNKHVFIVFEKVSSTNDYEIITLDNNNNITTTARKFTDSKAIVPIQYSKCESTSSGVSSNKVYTYTYYIDLSALNSFQMYCLRLTDAITKIHSKSANNVLKVRYYIPSDDGDYGYTTDEIEPFHIVKNTEAGTLKLHLDGGNTIVHFDTKNLTDPVITYNAKYLSSDGSHPFNPTKDYHPATKQYVDDKFSTIATAGTVECTGVILTSPNNTKYKLIVSDDGTLSTEAV